MIENDWIPLEELSQLSTYGVNSMRNMHARKSGPLASILCKFGGKLGCWRSDWESYKRANRKLASDAGDRLSA